MNIALVHGRAVAPGRRERGFVIPSFENREGLIG